MAILEQIPFLIRCRSRRGTIVFADCLNYFPVSLEELAENIGIVKLPAPGAESLTPDLVQHCTNKVSIVKSAITNLNGILAKGRFRQLEYDRCGVKSQLLAT